MLWRRRLKPVFQPFFRTWWRLNRGMTLGVRGVVVNGAGEVLLVEHTYTHGWHLPGGGVERGETAEQSLARELVEEAGVTMTAPPVLVGIHDNFVNFRGDHVICYRIDRWTQGEATSRGEIMAVRWVDPALLPPQVSPLTRRLIAAALTPLAPGARLDFSPPFGQESET